MECALNPALKDVPLAVSGNPEKRHGVILAKNELAKKAGIKTGDVIWQAMQKEPRLKMRSAAFFALFGIFCARIRYLYEIYR